MIVLTDIDDTLTSEGKLSSEAYQALWQLHDAQIAIIPVTGRPAGWCELIARIWPVAGVVGENGAFYFAYKNKKMIRSFDPSIENLNDLRAKLELIKDQILRAVPNCQVSSDQFCRMFDLAIDVCEDIEPLSNEQIQTILDIFKKNGATAKLSSIHINGWFGQFNKVDGSLRILKDLFNISPQEAARTVYFIGDSPNDEPMWSFFEKSYAVANIKNYLNTLTHRPKYVMSQPGGKGFVEFSNLLLTRN